MLDDVVAVKREARERLAAGARDRRLGARAVDAAMAEIVAEGSAPLGDAAAVLFAIRDCPPTGLESDAAAEVCATRCPDDGGPVTAEARGFLRARRDARTGLAERRAATMDIARFELVCGDPELFADSAYDAAAAGDPEAAFMAMMAGASEPRDRDGALAAVAAFERERGPGGEGARARVHDLMVDLGIACVAAASPLRGDPAWAGRLRGPDEGALEAAIAAMEREGGTADLDAGRLAVAARALCRP